MVNPQIDTFEDAPEEDEPLSAQDRQALKAGHKALSRGEVIPDEKLDQYLDD